MLIRPVTTADIPAMAAIRAAERGSQEYWEQRIAGYLAGEVNPQQALPERAAFVAEDAGAIAGFIAGHRTRRYQCDGELEWINTAASHRGQGIAARLLLAQAAWFVEQQAFRVCVNVAPDNEPAVAFYRKYGAQPLNKFFMVWPDVRTLALSPEL
ncbi:MAG TPA: GNAT family N-acetyltransferase [Acidobacteriaceae bacterium]|jgi:ribosomal protein S18 acetylase RimI-like enzyme|nr:GNAT family N-acetyltransferase [Acidobacteriaceae bacterium]